MGQTTQINRASAKVICDARDRMEQSYYCGPPSHLSDCAWMTGYTETDYCRRAPPWVGPYPLLGREDVSRQSSKWCRDGAQYAVLLREEMASGFDAGQGHIGKVLAGGDGEEIGQGLLGLGFASRVGQHQMQRGVVDLGVSRPFGAQRLGLVHVR